MLTEKVILRSIRKVPGWLEEPEEISKNKQEEWPLLIHEPGTNNLIWTLLHGHEYDSTQDVFYFTWEVSVEMSLHPRPKIITRPNKSWANTTSELVYVTRKQEILSPVQTWL